MKLVDTHGEWSTVLLPEFERITLGEPLQDVDLDKLAETAKLFYGDRLLLVPVTEEPIVEIAPAVETEPEPEPESESLPEPAVETIATEPESESIEPEPVLAPKPSKKKSGGI